MNKCRPTVVSDPGFQSGEGGSRQDKFDADTCSEYYCAQLGCHEARKDHGLDGYEPVTLGTTSPAQVLPSFLPSQPTAAAAQPQATAVTQPLVVTQ